MKCRRGCASKGSTMTIVGRGSSGAGKKPRTRGDEDGSNEFLLFFFLQISSRSQIWS